MRLLAALLCLLLVLPAAAEDVIVLKNGREARGRIVEETAEGVRLDLGGGSMFYRRELIESVRRGTPEAAAPAGASAPAEPSQRREEFSILYNDGARVATRVFRAARVPEGFRFEEEVVFLDAAGRPEMEVRSIERADQDLGPVSFQVRESAGEAENRMVTGEVRAGRLWLTVARKGEKTKSDVALPTGARFPFAARELFLRESRALGGRLSASVFDIRDERWRPVEYEEGGTKRIAHEGRVEDARVVVRRRGDLVEREWIGPDGSARMTELNGEALRALPTGRDVVERLRRGDTERVTGPDSAARTLYVDAEGGWRIGKPDPSWTFEVPPVRGAGALLSIRNEPLFATVDVLLDPSPAPGTTPERAAEALQRLCRSVAQDFRVLRDGYTDTPAGRLYWMEASATTKGERTRTLAHVLVTKGRVFRLLAACPDGLFDALRPDLERILGSFRVD